MTDKETDRETDKHGGRETNDSNIRTDNEHIYRYRDR